MKQIAVAMFASFTVLGGCATMDGRPTCRFQYTGTFRHEIVDPIIERLAGSSVKYFDSRSFDYSAPDGRNLRLVFISNIVDGGSIQIVIDPCTSKVVESVVDDGGPIVIAPPG
jgi:hypothetical protein